MWSVWGPFRSALCRSCPPLLLGPLRLRCSPLTTAQTAEVLRPFLFAVHPDFFGQYPKERAVNEHSLKQLYAHLDGIREESAHVILPKDLTFYLRNKQSDHTTQQGRSVFRSVTVSLLSKDIYATVSGVLESCSLSTSGLRELSTSRPRPFPRPVEWHQSYYAYTGKPDPKANPTTTTTKRQRAKDSLRSWLRDGVPAGRRNAESSQPVRQETERLHQSLLEALGLEELRWMSRWDVGAFRACLRSISKLHANHPEITKNLEGKKLVFGGVTGVSREGHVMLSYKGVELQWLAFLSTLPHQMAVLDEVSAAESRLSDLLGGGLRMCRHCARNPMRALTYLGLLLKLSDRIREHRRTAEGERDCQRIRRGSLADVEMNIVSDSGRLYTSCKGTLNVTASAQLPDLISFLLENGFRIKALRRTHRRYIFEEIAIVQACREELGLAGLSKEDSVTAEEMVGCCRRLMDGGAQLGTSLQDASLRIGHIYAVLWGGELCIPWNWKL